MKIHLIRHTKVNVENGVCYGQKDVDLADTFEQEAEVVKSKLKDINFKKAYSSPLSRCKKLAEFITEEITFDDRLLELNFGDWEGKEWEAINDPNLDKWFNDFINRKCSNGESFVMLKERVLDFLEYVKNQSEQEIVIFTHAGVIRTIYSHLNNISLQDAFAKASVDYGEINTFEL